MALIRGAHACGTPPGGDGDVRYTGRRAGEFLHVQPVVAGGVEADGRGVRNQVVVCCTVGYLAQTVEGLAQTGSGLDFWTRSGENIVARRSRSIGWPGVHGEISSSARALRVLIFGWGTRHPAWPEMNRKTREKVGPLQVFTPLSRRGLETVVHESLKCNTVQFVAG